MSPQQERNEFAGQFHDFQGRFNRTQETGRGRSHDRDDSVEASWPEHTGVGIAIGLHQFREALKFQTSVFLPLARDSVSPPWTPNDAAKHAGTGAPLPPGQSLLCTFLTSDAPKRVADGCAP